MSKPIVADEVIHPIPAGALVTPASGVGTLSKLSATRPLLATIDPLAQFTPQQPFFGGKKVGLWIPGGNATLNSLGVAGCSAVGTATSRVPASTNMCASLRRVGSVSAAGAGSLAQFNPQSSKFEFWRGNAAGLGGFHAIFRFNISDAVLVTTSNTFVGLRNNVMTDVDPATLTQLIGVGCDSSDNTTMKLYAAGAVAQAAVDLGANFPMNTTNVDVYELVLYCPPNAAYIDYQVTRLNVPAQAPATGRVSTVARLPQSTIFMGPMLSRSNGTTATAVGIDFSQVYVETEL